MQAYSRLAVFRAYLGDADRSDALIQQALEMAPDNPDVAYDHTAILARLDRAVQNREAVARLFLERLALKVWAARRDGSIIGAAYVLGVGLLLYLIIRHALKNRIKRLFVEASITAVPFFKLHGFKWIRDDEVVIGGVSMKVFIMETHLDRYFIRDLNG